MSGSSGSSPSGTSKQIVQQEVPEYFRPYLERIFGRAESISEEPYQPYRGQRLAAPSQQQLDALSQYKDYAHIAQPGIQSGYNALGQATTAFPDQDISQYMNPYTQQVTDVALREMYKRAEPDRQKLAAQAATSGAFGGSRYGFADAQRQSDLAQRATDIQVTGSQRAYDTARQQMEAEKGRALRAAPIYGSLGVQAQQAGLAGLGLWKLLEPENRL